MTEIKGICPIIATPFTENGEVDYESLDKLVKHLIHGGCHAVTLFGIAGEYYKLSDEERRKMVEVTVKAAKEAGGKTIISVTDHSTEVAVKTAEFFEQAGADCLMLLPPFFLKPGAGYLYEHMKAIGNAVKIPIMAQYAPEQTGVAIAPEVFVKLQKECPNIIYYKIECKPAGPYVSNLMTLTDGKMKVFVGNAGFQIIECMDRGAIGAMPGCSMYDVYLDIYNKYMQGDRAKAIAVHNKLLPMLNHIRQNVEQIISFEKRILKKRGIIKTDYCRKPSYNTDAYFDKLFEEFYAEMAKEYNW
ncbi:MAG: dihydrodipicolinate synthase family protein [Clostridia bacterium]|nr:dihydrodipicolinate synthase family protein [Clostridia bacterium]